MHDASWAFELDLAAGRIIGRRGGRRVEVRCEIDDRWLFARATIRWWIRDDGAREPVTDRDREWIVAAVLEWGTARGVGLVGSEPPPRPVRAAPPLREAADWELELLGRPVGAPDATILEWIDEALAFFEPLADQWDVAASIRRQLIWCRGTVDGTPVEPAPGPLSMGLLATRELDMYGSNPEMAALVNRIQEGMRSRGSDPFSGRD